MDGCKSEGEAVGGFMEMGDEGCWIEIRRFEILAEGKWFERDVHGEKISRMYGTDKLS